MDIRKGWDEYQKLKEIADTKKEQLRHWVRAELKEQIRVFNFKPHELFHRAALPKSKKTPPPKV